MHLSDMAETLTAHYFYFIDNQEVKMKNANKLGFSTMGSILVHYLFYTRW